jgi:transcriptional regulator with XRE-family HTH domain
MWMPAPDQALASTIRRMRLEHGFTQEDLAFKARITVSSVYRIERGLSNPAWATLLKIAAALGVTPLEIVAATEDTRKQSPAED